MFKDIFLARRSKSEGGIGFTPEKHRKEKKADAIQAQAPQTPLDILMRNKQVECFVKFI